MTVLVIIETVIIFSWALLSAILLNLIFGYFLEFLPFCYLFAAFLLAWIEHHGTRNSQGISPLEVIRSVEITPDGEMPSQWQSFRRVFFTPVSALPLGIGLLHTESARSLLNVISGTKVVLLDRSANPSPVHEQKMFHIAAILKVTGYCIFSAVVSITILFVSLQQDTVIDTSLFNAPEHMSQHDAELLGEYLELSAAWPDSLEFHVRLSSLYYRNEMTDDLTRELIEVHRLNPNHSILLLADDIELDFSSLEVVPDSMIDSTEIETIQPAAVSSTPSSGDNAETTEDSITSDSLLQAVDSMFVDSDTSTITSDSMLLVIDSIDTATNSLIPDSSDPHTDILLQPDSVETAVLSSAALEDTLTQNE